MKINELWLREFVDTPFDTPTIAERLTLAGLEVDGLEPAAPNLDGFIVAEVVAVEAHPDADRLRVCQVNDGQAEHTVVCGAPNVRAGMKAALAPPGVVLPGGSKIKVSKLRGIKSNGMLCSAIELELGEDAGGLLELPASLTAGTPLGEALALNDTIFDIGLTPNRGDCFSALGIARDLAVLSDMPFSEPVAAPVAPTIGTEFHAQLDHPQACARYAGRVIEGVDSSALTPLWMQERLRRCGVRCIHPLVDVTNYVMLEFGQPMHAFDFAALEGGIIVRKATADESLELLDGQTVELDAETLVIADQRQAVALAGVMGGMASAVSESTTTVFLESAFFDPVELAGVARRYRLHTDASTRFERGVDPCEQVRAIERASALIIEICGGKPGPVTVCEDHQHIPTRQPIPFRATTVNRLLGTDIAAQQCQQILNALGMSLSDTGDEGVWTVIAPSFRSDITIEADLVEEVARIHGYDQIPVRLPKAAAVPALPVAVAEIEHGLRGDLIGRGYFEAISYSFIRPDEAKTFHPLAAAVPLSNPISSDMAVMRPSLWPGLLGAATHNINRQIDDVRLFEIGQVFADAQGEFAQVQHIGGLRYGRASQQHWSDVLRDVDFFDVKQDIEVIFQNQAEAAIKFEASEHPALHPGQSAKVTVGEHISGFVGAIHPAIAKRYDIDKPLFLFEFTLQHVGQNRTPQFAPISRYPAVRRDISVVVDQQISAAACLDAAREGAGAILADLQLFDVYRGQGIDSDKKSVSLGLIFQDVSSTLTEDEVEAAVTRVLTSLNARVGGALRD